MDCLRCDRPMRRGPTSGGEGTVHAGNYGMCIACTTHTKRNGMVIDFTTQPAAGRPTADTIEDFQFLTESMGVRCRTNRFGYTKASMRRIAERLRLSIGALEHALDRARKAGA